LAGKKQYQRAVEQFMVARELNPLSSEVHYNLGRAYDAMDRFIEACDCYRIAIELNPSFIQARVNLGLALHQLDKFNDALDSYKAALDIDVNFHDAWLNMGTTLHEMNQMENALIAYEKALKINPNSEIAFWNRAQTDLTVGNFERGWDGYEYRPYGLHSNLEKYPTIPKANNINELIGKKILVWHEQGFGDTIQFARLIKKISNLNCQITLLVPPILLSLMRTLGGCEVRAEINEMDAFDFQLPLMSLPKLLSIDPNACEMITPYLNVDPMIVAQWVNKLNVDKNQVNIGLAVSGSALHAKNSKRTIRLQDIETILPIGRFYLLQKELNEVDKAYLETRKEIVFCGDQINNFEDTAAILKSMDIVISIDTSLAHLSGALNIKTLVLLPWVAEWRWQEKNERTAWYKNTILCRQDAAGDWGSAVKKAELSMSKLALRS
jgi:tetratricopeptide (TPR) repeat protein